MPKSWLSVACQTLYLYSFVFIVYVYVFPLSPDGKYVLTGGEDDLVTVWSMEDRKVVAWGEGHNSWVQFLWNYMSMLSFDLA